MPNTGFLDDTARRGPFLTVSLPDPLNPEDLEDGQAHALLAVLRSALAARSEKRVDSLGDSVSL